MTIIINPGDCLEIMQDMISQGIQVDAVVCDPPYHLTSIVKRFGGQNSTAAKADGATGVFRRSSKGFMGKEWDGGDIAFRKETWDLCFELLKPGGQVIAFSHSRTYHRMTCAIEDAGFEIRDQIMWLYGTGFPKSHDVSKGIDRIKGATRKETGQINRSGRERNVYGDYAGICNITEPSTDEAKKWDGWGTALKPAVEPICHARKPISESSVAANVLCHGTGAINIDACRIHSEDSEAKEYTIKRTASGSEINKTGNWKQEKKYSGITKPGRWPANVVHDGSPEVEAAFAEFGNNKGGFAAVKGDEPSSVTKGIFGKYETRLPSTFYDDTGSASRFLYSAKADKEDRWGSKHPTVKPVSLMRWLIRLITPPGGTILDPFAGSGSTGVAAIAENVNAYLIEKDPESLSDIKARIDHYQGDGGHSSSAKNRHSKQTTEGLPLFSGDKS
ncbi:site-specific DNA-methyltransferase [uncultured Kiloniella sp.]|uniref:site-specific DNA-methyltransferase n=1 Tax=uncultured Kiloniella sp. TaxID=1133091 RepID=UPI002614097A|nr:site-specific DNA-methyltransferase [uncultured Kiloniella sp.]